MTSKSCATGGVVHPIMAQHHQEKQIAPGNSTLRGGFEIRVTVCKLMFFFSECLKNLRIHESPSTCVMLRKFHWLILATSSFCPGGRSTDYPAAWCLHRWAMMKRFEIRYFPDAPFSSTETTWLIWIGVMICHDDWLVGPSWFYYYSPDLNAFKTTNQPSKGRDTRKE